MAYSNFPKALEVILNHEGGFVNHPSDPGGATNLGVTKKTYEEWVGMPVSIDIMKRLTVDKVRCLYKVKYWDRIKGDKLPIGLDLCVFDFAVNSGTNRAARYLQWMVGTKQDGIIGPKTLAAVNSFIVRHGTAAAITLYNEKRLAFLKRLGHFEVFGRGWTRRVQETEDMAFIMAAAT